MRYRLLAIPLIALSLILTMNAVSAQTKNVFLSTSFTLKAEQNVKSCYSEDFPLAIPNAGMQIFGTIKSSGYVFFSIMTDQQYNAVQHALCSDFRSTGILLAGEITSYSVNWTPPSSGRYHFVFLNTETYADLVSITLWTQ